jgi:hypothetical protein
MVAKLNILTHKIAIRLHLLAESRTICSSRSRRPVRKLLDTPSYRDAGRPHCGYEVGTSLSLICGKKKKKKDKIVRKRNLINRSVITDKERSTASAKILYLCRISLTGYWATGLVIGGFESRQGLGISLFTTASRPALGPTQPPIQCVPGALSLGIKRPGREADHSPPSSVEVKNMWIFTSTPQYASMAWCLVTKSTGTTLPYQKWQRRKGWQFLSYFTKTMYSDQQMYKKLIKIRKLRSLSVVQPSYQFSFCVPLRIAHKRNYAYTCS